VRPSRRLQIGVERAFHSQFLEHEVVARGAPAAHLGIGEVLAHNLDACRSARGLAMDPGELLRPEMLTVRPKHRGDRRQVAWVVLGWRPDGRTRPELAAERGLQEPAGAWTAERGLEPAAVNGERPRFGIRTQRPRQRQDPGQVGFGI
jgi:hypothetical protein